MSDIESSNEDVESDSDLELQEAYAKGLLKPGLNTVTVVERKKHKNDVAGLGQKLESIKLSLDWVERLDLINGQAPLAPELAYKLQEQELQHQARVGKSKSKGQKVTAVESEDPVVNEFHREMLFHRQAQAAVLLGIPRVKQLGIKTKRPDDYFAEMAKSDQHMQKVREHLQRKQHSQERSERVKQQRQLRKIGKKVQIEAKLRQASEKRELMEEVKKYRKGIRKDLDFLDDKKKHKPSSQGDRRGGPQDKRVKARRKYKDQKFGFGGKKRGLKKNTKASTSDMTEYRRSGKGKRGGAPQKRQRPGKNRRMKMKAKMKE
ncbi:probable rRNA-processing protein EBP2 homolog [Periplaneta americana]|uniref:probable rRNA-processing protein EBP2 homolog n=1 Tax=Periplaneta americana TaxID=6978 RepID=UPI0037E7C0D0